MIRTDSISKSFGEKKVLSNIDLQVRNGEILSLLGPNGCGKSTLLNIISGLAKQDIGDIYIGDILVSGKQGTKTVNLKPSERKVGYVFQTTSLFPHMRVQDNVAYGLKSMHLPKQEIKIRTDKLLDFVGLREYAKFYPNQLSGGLKQRVSLARSLAIEPQVLLLDEPVSAVDPELRESFMLELKKYLQALKITVIYVTHNLTEAFVMSDRIAVMGNCCIEEIGNKAEIFDKPKSKTAAKFLGLNIIQGKAIKTTEEMMELEINNTCILATCASDLAGKKIIATIKPEDITLSRKPAESGNCIEATVVSVTQMRTSAQITFDAGFLLKTRLPIQEAKVLGLTIGEKVFACFNFDALNVFADKES